MGHHRLPLISPHRSGDLKGTPPRELGLGGLIADRAVWCLLIPPLGAGFLTISAPLGCCQVFLIFKSQSPLLPQLPFLRVGRKSVILEMTGCDVMGLSCF